VQLTGESASTNEEGVKEQLKKIAEEAGYRLAQVFKADETWFFLKTYPTICIFKNLKDKSLACDCFVL
jgi:hypothetical protein